MSNTVTYNQRLDKELHSKIKYISWHETTTVTSIVTSAIEKEVKAFEKKHGAITEQQLKDARIVK